MHADEPSSDWERQIETRRAEYLEWIVENFGKLEPTMDPRDGRRWALNHARLVLNRDIDKANRLFRVVRAAGQGQSTSTSSGSCARCSISATRRGSPTRPRSTIIGVHRDVAHNDRKHSPPRALAAAIHREPRPDASDHRAVRASSIAAATSRDRCARSSSSSRIGWNAASWNGTRSVTNTTSRIRSSSWRTMRRTRSTADAARMLLNVMLAERAVLGVQRLSRRAVAALPHG